MKNTIRITLSLLLLLAVSGCSKWLDVKPKTEIKSDEQFLSEQGFKDAVIGCYILMSEESLYGKELSTNFIEVLAQQYDFKLATSSKYSDAAKYRYDMDYSKSIINSIWLNTYYIIANINNIIENLDKNKNVLNPQMYSIIKGEMYGLRAFLHFDLLCMFGPSDLSAHKDKLKIPTIPYMRKYSKEISGQSNSREILDFIYEDLAVACELLKDSEPLINGYESLNKDDIFLKDRFFRFNYYAAVGTTLRAKMWEGKYDEARKQAEIIIEKGNIPWIEDVVINSNYENARDLCFVTEQIFGLETFQRMDKVIKPYFTLKTAENIENKAGLFHTKTRADEIYEIAAGVGLSDYRYTRLYNKIGNEFEILKFWEYQNMNTKYINNLPLIKKAEIYYNIAECLNSTGKEDDRLSAIDYLNQVRRARGITEASYLPSTLTQQEIDEEITKEWRKEFVSEGHLFYYYKRRGFDTIKYSTVQMDDTKYMFPLPDAELNFGGRIDINKK